MDKLCLRCGARKPIGEFHVDNRACDGRHTYCKECKKALTKAHRATPGGRALMLARNARHQAKNAGKTKARSLLRDAVRARKIEKGPCEDCGTVEGVEGHHEDYSKPLDVNWKCRPCHQRHHAND